MYGLVKYISGVGNQSVKPSGVTWFGSEQLAKQYYGWQKQAEEFPLGEWGTDDYGRQVMVDVLTKTEIMNPDQLIMTLDSNADIEIDTLKESIEESSTRIMNFIKTKLYEQL